MNPRTLAFAVGCLVTVGLAGCGSDKNTPPPPPPPPAPAPVAAPAPPPPPAMPPGLTVQQQHVAQIQMGLNANGAHLDVDGRMGPTTRAALKAFQAQHKLKATGQPDAATIKALGG